MERHGITAAVVSISTPGVALSDQAGNRELARRCNEWAAGVVAYLRRLYYDTAVSASPYALPSVLALAGAGHLCFGTDFPFVPDQVVEETVQGLAAHAGLGDADRTAVERETALRLFPALASRLDA